MDVNIISTISAFSAVLVSIVSLVITLFINKKKIKTETITKNRIEWINSVRGLIMDFLDVYMDESIDSLEKRTRLSLIKYKISLYLRSNVKSYDNLIKSLNKCIENGYEKNFCDALIEKSQNVFSEVWIRAKIESGISTKENKKFEIMFKNYVN